jgi:hypothetical protein
MYICKDYFGTGSMGTFTPRETGTCSWVSQFIVHVWKPCSNLCKLTLYLLETIGTYRYFPGSGMVNNLVLEVKVLETKYSDNVKICLKSTFEVIYGGEWFNLLWNSSHLSQFSKVFILS